MGRVGKYAHAPCPDLVLLDLRLPVLDGLDVLAAMKDNDSMKHIPVVIMTASEDEADRLQCQAANVDAYLKKPMDLQKFLTVVAKLREFWKHGEVILPSQDQS
jgi:CheY-like chemotaxis protein